jgi:cytochrome c-type biogenesis protein CcmH/NrfG
LRASEELHTDRGVALLRDALAVDACEVETWRLLGRLEVEAGHTASAVPQLAVAVALSPREAAPLVDLADALLVLDAATPADQTAFAAARDLLADRRPTKTLVSGAHGPRDLARALYAAYLERTATDADRHRSRRRRVQQEIRRLGGSAAKEPSGSGAHPSRHL